VRNEVNIMFESNKKALNLSSLPEVSVTIEVLSSSRMLYNMLHALGPGTPYTYIYL
jgi:hypothetical protein